MSILNKSKSSQFGFKIVFLTFFLSIISIELFAQTEDNSILNRAVDGGIGLGSIIAVVASWSRNKSILFGIIHGLMGWFYVVYFLFTREPDPDTNRDDTVNDDVYKDDIFNEQKN